MKFKTTYNPSVVVHLSSTAVHTVVAAKSPCGQHIELAVVSSVSTDSFFAGKVLHRDNLVRAIKKTIQEAEERSGLRIENVVVCVTSTALMSDNVLGQVTLDPELPVDSGHMSQALSFAKEKFVASEYYLTQFATQMIWLNDDTQSVKDALGMTGVRQLVASYHLMALPAEILNGIYNVVQEVIEVNSVVFDVVAGATYCLMPDERKSGVLFIDIGAKVTNICVYKDEVLLLTGVFAWGGDDVTTELAKQCNISYKEAERLKRQYGTLGEINDKTDFANAQKDGQNTVVHRDKLNQIIKQCYRQVFCDIVAYMDSKSIPKEFCDAGIVLAGGGAQMQGMVAYTKKTLRMPVHLANSNPQITLHKERLQDEQIKTLGFEINNRKLYPAFGALLYDLNDELRREQDIYEPTAERSKLWQALHRYKQTLLNWLHRHA